MPEAGVGTTVKSRWETLDGERSSVLKRAREAAELTIPAVLPAEGHSETTEISYPSQSAGAQGVVNLASKLLLALFPPGVPFFKFNLSKKAVGLVNQQERMLKEQGAVPADAPSAESSLEEAAGSVEQDVLAGIEEDRTFRANQFQALKSLIVTGNTCVDLSGETGGKVIRLDRYACRRDLEGELIELIIKETVARESLDPKLLPPQSVGEPQSGQSTQVDVYTHCTRSGDEWTCLQEMDGQVIGGTEATYPHALFPYLVLRWTAVHGENYGRGLVESCMGDLSALESLTNTLVGGSVAAARTVFLVNPNGVTRVKDLNECANGGFVAGLPADVVALKVDKAADFQTALGMYQDILRRLKEMFLLSGGITRDAERVTAEEIRLLAGELEAALGGVYSVLSQDYQYRLLDILLNRMKKSGRIKDLPKDLVSPAIVTGVAALGRGAELNRLKMFMTDVAALPNGVMALNVPELISRLAVRHGLDKTNLVKSAQQMQQEQQAAMQAQLAQSVAPGVAQEVTKGAVDGKVQLAAQDQG